MNRKNRGGRPTIEASEKRAYRISTRLKLNEIAVVEAAAQAAGITVSDYTRQAVINGKIEPRITPEMMSLIRRLCGMDNNLNQIARQANTVGYTLIHRENLRLSDRINTLLTKLKE